MLANARHLPPGWMGIPPDLAHPLDVFWSLSVEEYFYIVWAPIVLHFSRRSLVWIACIVCPVEMLLRWLCNSDTSYFAIFFRFDALLYGALLALLFDYWKRRNLRKWSPIPFKVAFTLCMAGLIAIFLRIRPVLGREIRSSLLFEVFGLALISVATTSLIAILILEADSSWWLSRLLRTRPMQFLGTISYTLYLVHCLVYVLIAHALFKMHLPLSSGHLNMIIAVLSSVVAILVARLSWHYLEHPLLRWKDKHFPGTRVAEPVLQ
ncbi:MAG: acyltransferase [Edaphobacter sp.]